MNYLYANTPFRKTPLAEDIQAAASRLVDKLKGFSISTSGLSAYNQTYLGNYLKNPVRTFQRYTFILYHCLEPFERNFKDLRFLEIGGGAGLLSLLAKELGIGTVIYSDVYGVSVKDFHVLSKGLGTPIDLRLCGDEKAVCAAVNKHFPAVDMVASNDVIEHIYDLEQFVGTICQSVQPGMFFMASGANSKNPLRSLPIMLDHLRFEYAERAEKSGHKQRDVLGSYYCIRKEFLAEQFPSLSQADMHKIALKTRGFTLEDIARKTGQFQAEGTITWRKHISNTCDPHTGNWAERLYNLRNVKRYFSDNNYALKIESGYYPYLGGTLDPLIKMLNRIIATWPAGGIYLAPFFALHAQKRKE